MEISLVTKLFYFGLEHLSAYPCCFNFLIFFLRSRKRNTSIRVVSSSKKIIQINVCTTNKKKNCNVIEVRVEAVRDFTFDFSAP